MMFDNLMKTGGQSTGIEERKLPSPIPTQKREEKSKAEEMFGDISANLLNDMGANQNNVPG